jgi:serine/threonine protein kinase
MSGDLQRVGSLETILRPGQVVGGKYRVDRLIAKGGMAAVWAGVNQRTGKRIALKVILRSFAAIGGAAELFRREALAASKVNHPNVVSIFDVIDHEGMTCIVMELLDGETLASYLGRNGALSLHEAVTLLLPAMRGVAAANAQGVVHRDLKPGNIFLCSGTDGRLLATKVLDFGIATMVERTGETSTGTVPMAGFGTPAYMAPEAIECSPSVDGRTDVYGFGVLLFEALTGQVPFPGEPSTALLARIITEAPPKVSEYRPDLPAEVVHLIDRALAKNADDRFANVDDLIRAVEERLVPPSAIRAVTPMTGVSQSLMAASNSGAAHQSETKVLYSLTSSPTHTTVTAVAPSKIKLLVAIAVDRARSALPLLRDIQRFLQRRTAMSVTLAVVLIATVSLAISGSSKRRGHGTGVSSSSPLQPTQVQEPRITSLPSTPSPSPVATTGGLAESSAASTDVRLDDQTFPVPTHATQATSALGTTRERVANAQATRGQPRHANPARRTPGPRAGRLSASDF